MNLSSPFIKRPVMTTFVMLAIVIAGLISYRFLPVSDMPTLEAPCLSVDMCYPGAAPDVVLNEITIPIEKELANVQGIKELWSTSSQGSSHIMLTFDMNKNMDEAVRDLQAALHRAEARLPDHLTNKPTYNRQERNQEPMMYLLLLSPKYTVGELRNYADAYIVPRLNRVEGVANVGTFGSSKAIWIRVNPEMLAAKKIGFDEVINTVKAHTGKLSLGAIQTGSKTLAIELTGSLQEAKRFEDLYIGTSNVKLRDVAEVTEKSDTDEEFHFYTGEALTSALVISIIKANDGNTVSISKSLQGLIGTIQKELPPTIQLHVILDKAIWIQQSLVDVQWSLFFAFILVVAVIYFSLGRFVDAFIPSVALPLSILGTLIIMYLLHYSLDLLSLLALTLSVGFVVDDAIVVLENIVRHQEEGKEAKEASFAGSKQISFTILSMTLSLVAVFIPLLFMSGMNGRLFREFSVTLSVAILVSGFISLSLTPMLCSRILSKHKAKEKRASRITAFYERTLKTCLSYPKTVLLVALGCMLITVPLFMKLPVQLFPPEDRGFLIAFVNLPSGISPQETKVYQGKLEELMKTHQDVLTFFDCGFDSSLVFFIGLKPPEHRPEQAKVIASLQQMLDQVPGIRSFIQGFQLINLDFDLGGVGQYQYIIRGIEPEDVEKAAEQLSQILSADPTFAFVQSSIKNDAPKLNVHVDDELAHRFGFSKQAIQEIFHHAYSKSPLTTLHLGQQEKHVYLDLDPEFRHKLSTLSKIFLKSGDNLVPLKAMARWEEKLGVPNIDRLDGLATATLHFALNPNVAPNEGILRFEQEAAKLLPKQVMGSLTGQAKLVSKTMFDTLLLLLAAAVVMYIVLGILYESFIHPLTILSSLPFAGLGGIITLFCFNEPISIFSAVGFLLLLGIVKKNGIMMVDYALEARKMGLSPEEAIYQGSIVRFRPIMMTTIAAIMGAIPIAIGFGEGAEMRRGLGLVIVGGLLFSQVLTLYVTPIIYLTFERLRQKAIPLQSTSSA